MDHGNAGHRQETANRHWPHAGHNLCISGSCLRQGGLDRLERLRNTDGDLAGHGEQFLIQEIVLRFFGRCQAVGGTENQKLKQLLAEEQRDKAAL